MDKMTQMFYDKEGDILYLSVGEPRRAISEEVGDDILLRVDPDNGEVVGLTVLNFSTRFSSLTNPQTLPVEMELHKLPESRML